MENKMLWCAAIRNTFLALLVTSSSSLRSCWRCSHSANLPRRCLHTGQVAMSVRDQRNLQLITQSISRNPNGLRIFHPSFPLELLNPISISDAADLLRIREMMPNTKSNEIAKELQKLPWLTFPKIGIPEGQAFLSKAEVMSIYDRTRHWGHLVWAHQIDRPKKGCLLLNHWKQQVIYLAEYDPDRGAKGYELNQITLHNISPSAYPIPAGAISSSGGGCNIKSPIISWPPLALETELRQNRWQLVATSENIISGEVLTLLPPQMPKAVWEFIFALLISAGEKDSSPASSSSSSTTAVQGRTSSITATGDDSYNNNNNYNNNYNKNSSSSGGCGEEGEAEAAEKEVLQALLDTGLSPRKGLFAYLRLLEKVLQRTDSVTEVPEYRQIVEREIKL